MRVANRGFLVVGGLHDQMIDDAMRFVDVLQSAIPQTAHGRVIFFPCDVIVSFIQQLQRAVVAAGAVHSGIDRRMIAQVFAVVDGSALDFVDGSVNFCNGVLFFFVHVMSGSQVLQVSARVAQIRERVQVCRMPSRFVGKAQGGADSDNKHKQGAMACDFHGFLEAFRQNELR
jgi:hypothetical protein